MQTAVLAVADTVAVGGALTYFSPKPALLIQATLVILLLAMAIAVSMTGEPVALWNVGLGSIVIFAAYVGGMSISRAYESRESWKAVNPPEVQPDIAAGRKRDRAKLHELPMRRISMQFSLAGIVVLVGGWCVASSADALTKQTGIAATFIGATLVAIVTSLPELSTTLQAVRIGNYEMAISNIFGSNAFTVSLLLVSDVFFRSGPILAETSSSTSFIAALSIILTAIYLYGMLERGNRTVLGVGWDSVAVAFVYLAGLWMLYSLK